MVKTRKRVVDKIPRPYQLEALDKALSNNTILCLPTGSGKTFIATIVLKEHAGELNLPYNENGKRAFFLVPNQVLVQQQAKAIENDTTFNVGRFSGTSKDKDGTGIDDWTKAYWDLIFMKYQVLVMTRKIFFDIIASGHIKTSSIAVIIFDEAHHGAPNAKGKNTNHDYVRIMEILKEKGHSNIRIIGLTASLINNRWVDENKLESMIKEIGNTYCADVFSPETSKISNANEIIWTFKVPEGWDAEFPDAVKSYLSKMSSLIGSISGMKKNQSIHHEDLSMVEEMLGNAANPIPLDLIKNTFTDLEHIFSTFGPWATHRTVAFVLESYERELELINHLENSYNEIIQHVISLLKNLEKSLRENLVRMSKRDALLAGIPNKMLRLLQFLYEFNRKKDSDPISAIIFVERRLDAYVLSSWLSNIAQFVSGFDFIKCDFTVGFSSYNPFPFNSQFRKKQETVITRFREKTLNILVSTSVLEEGLDINHCNCIVRYDKPTNYRAYVQSKGRARSNGAYFIFFAKEAEIDATERDIEKFRDTERKLRFLSKPCQAEDSQVKNSFEMLQTSAGGILPLYEAKTRVIFYCDHLPADGYTVKMPKKDISIHRNAATNFQLFKCKLTLPKISPYHKLPIFGRKCSTAAEAEASAYFEAAKELWAHQELDDSFRPLDRKTLIARLMKKYNLDIDRTEMKEWEEQKAAIKRSNQRKKRKERIALPPKPGTKKKRRQYPIIFSDKLKGYQSMDSPCWLYKVSAKNEKQEETSRLGLISFYPLPLEEIEGKMLIYSSKENLTISLELIENFVLKEQQLENIRHFQEFIFSGCLKIGVRDESKESSIFFTAAVSAYHLLYIFLTDDKNIDYQLLKQTYHRRPIQPSDYSSLTGALISKNYGVNQRGLLVVKEVDFTLSPKSPFVNESYATFEDYYKTRYGIKSLKSDQPLLCCHAAPTKTFFPCQPDRKAMKLANSPQIVHLVPELCSYEYFSYEYLDIIYTIPAISSVINQYLNASAIRRRLCSEIGYGIAEIPVDEKYNWDQRYKFTNFPEMKVKIAEYTKPKESIDLSCVIVDHISPSNGGNMETQDVSHPEDTDDSDSEDSDDSEEDDDDSSSETAEDDEDETSMNTSEDTYNTVYQNLPVVIKRANDSSLFNELTPVAQPSIAKVSWNGNNVKLNHNLLQDYEKKLKTFNLRSWKSSQNGSNGVDFNELDSDNDSAKETNHYVSTTPIYTDKLSLFKYGLPIELIVEAFTTKKADSKINLERLEIIGDSFLKYIVSALLFLQLNDLNEARITYLKMTLVSNFYLLHLGRSKGLAQYINDKTFLPRLNWLPPFYSSANRNFTEQEISDKSVADMMEALLGAHLICLGEKAAISFLSWIGMPLFTSFNFDSLMNDNSYLPSYHDTVPIENPAEIQAAWRCGNLSKLEQKLGYTFKRKDLLIEALTHPSWSRSHFNSYQRLEFLGDAILDYLITSYIFDNQKYQHLKPGEVTIIRQALVNNDYFATISLVNGFDKFIFHLSPTLYKEINTFREQLTKADLFGENKIKLGSFLLDNLEMETLTEPPKALGDIFESIAGAIYLDSGNSLSTVWHIYCKFFCNELEFFCANVPKSPILRLFEAFPFAKFVSEKLPNKESKRKRLNLIVDGWSFKVDETKLLEDAMNKRTEKHYLVLSALNKLAK
ncbi:endoribonuclease Dicer [Tetranychus urticae]|uniref:Dicer-2 n=1 Tax=Tetranychus urticae TaxID=32264 RepID=T1K8D9_TETUR|nr:endoribonuclease Dicer [Tetranychus urticae]